MEINEITKKATECLPIGTVVKIGDKDNHTLFMIVGYLPKNEKGEKRDYIAVSFPIGLLSKETYFFFNQSAIYEIVFEGYRCDEFRLLAELIQSELSI